MFRAPRFSSAGRMRFAKSGMRYAIVARRPERAGSAISSRRSVDAREHGVGDVVRPDHRLGEHDVGHVVDVAEEAGVDGTGTRSADVDASCPRRRRRPRARTARRPAFDALYAASCGTGTMPAMLATWMIEPPRSDAVDARRA